QTVFTSFPTRRSSDLYLFRQDKKDEDDFILVKSFDLSNQSLVKPTEFRFVNDFSNRFEYSPPDLAVWDAEDITTGVSFDFDGEKDRKSTRLNSSHVKN